MVTQQTVEIQDGQYRHTGWLTHVARFLPQSDRLTAMQVCHAWYDTLSDPNLWKEVDLSERATRAPITRLVQQVLPHARYQLASNLNFEFQTELQDEDLGRIPQKELAHVNLNACQRVSDSGVKALLRRHKQLQSLQLYWNVQVTDRTAVAVAAYCSQTICKLNLSGCKQVGSEGISILGSTCTNLVDLDLTRNPTVSDAAIGAVLSGCPQLQVLRLYANAHLTERAFDQLHVAAELRVLDLCGLRNVNDAVLQGVAHLAEGCLKLRQLSLHGNCNVTDNSIASLAAGPGPTLTALDVCGCVGIHRKAPKDLLELLPNLAVFKLHS